MKAYLLLLSVLCTVSSYAFQLTPAQAFARVSGKQMLSTQLNTGAPEFKLIKTITADNNPTCYIINSEGKTLILSASSNTQPLLAELDGEYIPGEEEMSGMQCMLDKYSQEISEAEKSPFHYPKQAFSYTLGSEPWEDYTKIKPLIKVDWGQGSPYNQTLMTCKKDGTGEILKFLTGCGATALAQIVHYWKNFAYDYDIKDESDAHLKLGTGEFVCPDNYKMPNGFSGSWDTVNLENDQDAKFTLQDFLNMRNSYRANDLINSKEVARLMKICGYSIDSNYKISYSNKTQKTIFETTARVCDMKKGLKRMGYSADSLCSRSSYTSDNEWLKLIYQELKEKTPVLYVAKDINSISGHWFVIDGFKISSILGFKKTPMVHIKWGWNGRFDGYYALNNLSVDGCKFNMNEQAFINCRPVPYPRNGLVVHENADSPQEAGYAPETTLKDGNKQSDVDSPVTAISGGGQMIYKTTRTGKRLLIK